MSLNIHIKYVMESSDFFFKILQLRDFMTKHKEWNMILKPTGLEEFLIKLQSVRSVAKVIFPMCKKVLLMNPTSSGLIL